LSYDGSRLVFSQPVGKIIGVNADGSNYHEIPHPLAIVGATTTLTRDGQHVFFGSNGTTLLPFGECYRVGWDGTGLQLVSNFLGQILGYLHEFPVNFDGSLQAHWFREPPQRPFGCLAIAALDKPWLTIYPGYTPAEDVIWDIAGQPGDSWILAWAPGPAVVPPGGPGTPALDPQRLQVLATGTVGGPYNVGTLKVALPTDLAPHAHVPLHFQALVTGDKGSQLTNVTTLTLGSILDSPGPPPVAAASSAQRIQPYVPTEHERWLRFIASDPQLWRMYGEPLIPKRPAEQRGR